MCSHRCVSVGSRWRVIYAGTHPMKQKCILQTHTQFVWPIYPDPSSLWTSQGLDVIRVYFSSDAFGPKQTPTHPLVQSKHLLRATCSSDDRQGTQLVTKQNAHPLCDGDGWMDGSEDGNRSQDGDKVLILQRWRDEEGIKGAQILQGTKPLRGRGDKWRCLPRFWCIPWWSFGQPAALVPILFTRKWMACKVRTGQ